jgi:hypothetical protein
MSSTNTLQQLSSSLSTLQNQEITETNSQSASNSISKPASPCSSTSSSPSSTVSQKSTITQNSVASSLDYLYQAISLIETKNTAQSNGFQQHTSALSKYF